MTTSARVRRGFTLAELTVVLALFGLFATTALASLNMALGHWRKVAQKVDVAAQCRFVASAVSNELRQGVPNPAPGTTGYRGLSPTVAPTAVLMPNENQRTSTELVFTEPNPATFNPLASGFNAEDPSLYRRVRYYRSGGLVRREVKAYNNSGTVTSTSDHVVASQDDVALSFTWLAPDLFSLDVTCKRGQGASQDSANLKTQVYVIGR